MLSRLRDAEKCREKIGRAGYTRESAMKYCRYVIEPVEGLTNTRQYRIIRDVSVGKSMPDRLKERGVPVEKLAERWAGLDRSSVGSLPAHRELDAEVMRDLQQARGMANRLEWPEEKEEE